MDIKVYSAISAVQGELAKQGISKDKTTKDGLAFKYRGIDDVYAALASLLADNNLCILPRMMSKEVVERSSAKGNALFYTTVLAEFDFVSAEDGSKHTVSAYGEAMDSGDKSVGKAMSYAYKAMAFMAFSIPTEGDNDPDANVHEVASKASVTSPAAPQSTPAPQQAQSTNHGVCKDCGAANKWSAKKNKAYCGALCWDKPKASEPMTVVEAAKVTGEVHEDETDLSKIPF